MKKAEYGLFSRLTEVAADIGVLKHRPVAFWLVDNEGKLTDLGEKTCLL